MRLKTLCKDSAWQELKEEFDARFKNLAVEMIFETYDATPEMLKAARGITRKIFQDIEAENAEKKKSTDNPAR